MFGAHVDFLPLFARFFRFGFLFLGIMKEIYRNTDAKRNAIAGWRWIEERRRWRRAATAKRYWLLQ